MTVIWVNGTNRGVRGRLSSGHLCCACGLAVWGGVCGLNRGGAGWGNLGRGVSRVVSDSDIRAPPKCFLVPAAHTARAIRVTAPVISSLVVPLKNDSVFSLFC